MKLKLYFLIILTPIYSSFFAQKQLVPKKLTNEKKINSIKIGNQTWMAFNLNVVRFNNGDIIPEARTNDEWRSALKLHQPAWCNFENSYSFGSKYGKLYNYYAVSDKRGLVPIGWHIPSDKEWNELETFIGPDDVGAKLKSIENWKIDDFSSDIYKFNALPSGGRYRTGEFTAIGEFACWWESNSENTGRFLIYNNEKLNKLVEKGMGISIRLIKN